MLYTMNYVYFPFLTNEHYTVKNIFITLYSSQCMYKVHWTLNTSTLSPFISYVLPFSLSCFEDGHQPQQFKCYKSTKKPVLCCKIKVLKQNKHKNKTTIISELLLLSKLKRRTIFFLGIQCNWLYLSKLSHWTLSHKQGVLKYLGGGKRSRSGRAHQENKKQLFPSFPIYPYLWIWKFISE